METKEKIKKPNNFNHNLINRNAHHKARYSLSVFPTNYSNTTFNLNHSKNQTTPSLINNQTQSKQQSNLNLNKSHSNSLTRYLSSTDSSDNSIHSQISSINHPTLPTPSSSSTTTTTTLIHHPTDYSPTNSNHPQLNINRFNSIPIDTLSNSPLPPVHRFASHHSSINPINTTSTSVSGSGSASSVGMRSSINQSSHSNPNNNPQHHHHNWSSNPSLAGSANRSSNLLLDPRSASTNPSKDRNNPNSNNGNSNNGNSNNSSTSQLEAKVVILGMQGVGKTSIVHRYTTGSFSYSLTSTIGASFCTKKLSVDGCKVRLQIWDTAGQERFRSMAPMYYRGANAAILVYDITNMESFLDIQNWLNELKQNMTSDLIIQIVGSKADLGMHQRAVQLDEAYKKIIEWTQPNHNGHRTQVDPTTGGFQFNLIHDEDESFLSAIGHHHLHHSNPNLDELSSAGTSSSNATTNNNNNNLNNNSNNNNNVSMGNSNCQTNNTHNLNNVSNSGSTLDFLLGSNSNNPTTSSNITHPSTINSGSSFSRWNHVGISEVSAKDDFGIEDLFLILTRRLVLRKVEIEESKANKNKDSILIGHQSLYQHHHQNHLDGSNDLDSRIKSGWCC